MTKMNSFLLTLIIIIGSFHISEAKKGKWTWGGNYLNGCKSHQPRERHRRLTTASEPSCCTTLCNKQTVLCVGAALLASYTLTTLFISMHNVNAREV